MHARSTTQVPINHAMDIAGPVNFAARGNVLELPDLRDVAKTLGVLQTLKGFVELRRGSGMPQLAAYAEEIDLPEELLDLLTDAFDEDGCVSACLPAPCCMLHAGCMGLHTSLVCAPILPETRSKLSTPQSSLLLTNPHLHPPHATGSCRGTSSRSCGGCVRRSSGCTGPSRTRCRS